MAQFCGACGANVQQPGQQVLHPALDGAHYLCGDTGKRTLTYTTLFEATKARVEDPVTKARRELAVVLDALAHHTQHEDTPCEVSTEGGWMDVIDLLEPLCKALDP